MTYPVAAGSQAKRDFQVSAFPTAFLVGPEGDIIWTDNFINQEWHGVVDRALEEAAAMAPEWDPGEVPAMLTKAADLCREAEFGKAWREVENLRKKHAEAPEQLEQLDAFAMAFEARAKTRMAKAQEYADAGMAQVATDFLTAQVKLYKGSPPATRWGEQLKAWKKDREFKALVALDKKRLKALEAARAGERADAVKELRKLLEKADGTPLAGTIHADIERIRG